MPRSGTVVMLCLLTLCSLPALAGPVTLLSRADPENPSGTAGGAARVAGVSSDGRYTLFISNAGNLLSGVEDVNGGDDLFLHDRVAGTTTLVSHAALDPATTGDAATVEAALSADGHYVAFQSLASNLVPGQIDGAPFLDLFLWNRDLDETTLISHVPGAPLLATGLSSGVPGLSADGARIVFLSASNGLIPEQTDDGNSQDAFLYDRLAGSLVLISHTSSSNSAAAGGVFGAAISADGNWVAFSSNAGNLVAGQLDANGLPDVFLFARATSANVLVSHTPASSTTTANGISGGAAISADGSRIAYVSDADNLMTGQLDPDGQTDVFLYDRAANSTVLVSHTVDSPATAGSSASTEPSLSDDGRFVAFTSSAEDLISGTDFGGRRDVFLYDRNPGANVLVSHSNASQGTTSNGRSVSPRIAADGSCVVFRSDGSNLVTGQIDTGLTDDLFLWTRSSGTLSLVSHEAGSPATSGRKPSGSSFGLSGTGAWIALASSSTTLVPGIVDLNVADDLFLFQQSTGQNSLLSARGGPVSASAGGFISFWNESAMSNDGRYVAFSSEAPNLASGIEDDNDTTDVFLYDRLTGGTTLVSHASASPTVSANARSLAPLVSPDGSVVLFASQASDLIPGSPPVFGSQLFLWDRALGQITLVSHSAASPSAPGNGGFSVQGFYDVSGDGRWIAFADFASNLIAGQSDSSSTYDVFLYDRAAGTTTLVSHSTSSPTQTGNGDSGPPEISGDGRYIAFQSFATDLVSGEPSPGGIFVYDRIAGTTRLVTPSASGFLALSADGQRVVFTSSADNLVPGQVDTNLDRDVFLWDRATASIRLVSHVPNSAATAGDGVSDIGTGLGSVISADGRWIVFSSAADNLVAGQTEGNTGMDVFLYDALSGNTTLASRSAASANRTGDQGSYEPVLSADGRFATFLSAARDLVPGQIDPLYGEDHFLYDREAGTIALVSHIPSSEVTSMSPTTVIFEQSPRISADGAWVAFTSAAPDLAAGDLNGTVDAFLHANALPGRDFFTVSPCRVLDTREQAPVLTSGIPRKVTVAGSCGIPATARAVAANVTVLQSTGPGRLTLHPGDLAAPVTSTINFSAGITRANSAMLQLALDGTGTLALTAVVNGGGTVHAIVDVSGYFE